MGLEIVFKSFPFPLSTSMITNSMRRMRQQSVYNVYVSILKLSGIKSMATVIGRCSRMYANVAQSVARIIQFTLPINYLHATNVSPDDTIPRTVNKTEFCILLTILMMVKYLSSALQYIWSPGKFCTDFQYVVQCNLSVTMSALGSDE